MYIVENKQSYAILFIGCAWRQTCLWDGRQSVFTYTAPAYRQRNTTPSHHYIVKAKLSTDTCRASPCGGPGCGPAPADNGRVASCWIFMMFTLRERPHRTITARLLRPGMALPCRVPGSDAAYCQRRHDKDVEIVVYRTPGAVNDSHQSGGGGEWGHHRVLG